MQQALVNRAVIILVLGVISFLFYKVVQPFLLSIFIAALFSAMFTPLYRWFLSHVGQRAALASIMTLLTVLFFVFAPLFWVFGIVLSQGLDVAQTARPWVQEQLAQPGLITEKLEALPFYDQLLPYREMALDWLGKFTGAVSSWAVDAVQAATVGTFSALLSLLIILYTMFFFLIDGDRLLYYLLYYLPLNDDDEKKLLVRFTSVTRATLKGTAVIGILQGTLAGLALHFAGIPSALFWAVAMMFLSVVPGIGTALVWGPAVVFLIANGEYVPAIALAAFCLVVVGSVDNLLRPKLVGNDTRLHELMIFFSTLGGLLLFGFMGFVIGPIIAALFVTMWELYAVEFKEWLPTTAYKPKSGSIMLPHERMLEATESDEVFDDIFDDDSAHESRRESNGDGISEDRNSEQENAGLAATTANKSNKANSADTKDSEGQSVSSNPRASSQSDANKAQTNVSKPVKGKITQKKRKRRKR
ncbi:MAG: AI-2E family transporter [Gammaproteobacteria bacterium]|nr:AI-2E family transporter [Gammaproteobacteria bacterium]